MLTRQKLTCSVISGKWLLFVIGWVLIAATPAVAEEHYVETTRELYDAALASEPGDEIVMANGTWTDAILHFKANGVEGDSIRLRAETPGKVVLTGSSRLLIGGDYLVVEGLLFRDGALEEDEHVIQFRDRALDVEAANHSRLTNTAVIDYNPEERLTQYKWVSIYGTHNRVDHSYFAGKTHDGTTLVVWLEDEPEHEPNYHRIDHNYFGPRPELGKNGGETIRIGTSDRSMQSSRTTVENNLFERCNGEHEIISNKSGDNTFQHNTFVASQGTLTLRHGNRATVRGNFFFGRGSPNTGGVRVIGEDHRLINNYFQNLEGSGFFAALPIMNGVPDSPLNRYFQVKNALIAFNTFVGCRTPFIIGLGADAEKTLRPKNVTIANNVVRSGSDGPIITLSARPIDMTWEGNIMHGEALGIPKPDGITVTQPQLEKDEYMWRPTEESPALGAAVGGYSDVEDDVDGQPRRGEKDVGADQRSDMEIVHRPLTPDDAGPAWLESIVNLDAREKLYQAGR